MTLTLGWKGPSHKDEWTPPPMGEGSLTAPRKRGIHHMPNIEIESNSVSKAHMDALVAAIAAEDEVGIAELIALHLIGFTDYQGFEAIAPYYFTE